MSALLAHSRNLTSRALSVHFCFRQRIRSQLIKQNGNRLTNMSTNPPGKTITLDNAKIHYEQVGTGDEVVLLLPGGLGSTRTDFDPQLRKLNHEKFTLVAWDPPGFGFSRPPDRNFSKTFYHTDAEAAAALMRKLNFPKYSLLGWSDGGNSALIIAAKNQDAVKRLVVFGSNAYISANDMKSYAAITDVDNWSPRTKDPLVKLYGEQYFRKLCSDWVGAFNDIYRDGGNICRESLADIRCPTLIIHGKKDAMVGEEHPKYLHENIKGSLLEVFPEGKHNLHLRYADEFNKLVENFLLKK